MRKLRRVKCATRGERVHITFIIWNMWHVKISLKYHNHSVYDGQTRLQIFFPEKTKQIENVLKLTHTI